MPSKIEDFSAKLSLDNRNTKLAYQYTEAMAGLL